MHAPIAIIAGKPTTALELGYLPAARHLGLKILLLTDRPDEHMATRSMADVDIVACEVTSPMSMIDALERLNQHPGLVFSDSDHLQASSALVAEWFGLPRKDWRAAHAAKNKAIMRNRLAAAGIEQVNSLAIASPDDLGAAQSFPMPAILKPLAGVASEDVSYVPERDQLEREVHAIWARSPGRALVLETFLPGELRTLETLGDGHSLHVLGGFTCTLAPPPGFVVETMIWRGHIASAEADAVIDRLRALGVGFGICHTEYVVGPQGIRIIEINYRTIGDGADRLIANATGYPLHEAVLRLHLGEPLTALPVPPHEPVFAGLGYQFGTHIPPIAEPNSICRHDVLTPQVDGSGPRTNRHYRGRVSVIASDEAALVRQLSAIINRNRQEIVA